MLHLTAEYNPNRYKPDAGDILELGGIGLFVFAFTELPNQLLINLAGSTNPDGIEYISDELGLVGTIGLSGLFIAANSRNIYDGVRKKLRLPENSIDQSESY